MDDLASLIALIPPQYLVYLPLVPLASSLLAWALKAALGTPSPSDPAWKKFCFAVAKALDVLAVNTRKVADADKLAKLDKQVGELSRHAVKQQDALDKQSTTIARQMVSLREKP